MASDHPNLSRAEKFFVLSGLLFAWECYMLVIFGTLVIWGAVIFLLFSDQLGVRPWATSEQIPGYFVIFGSGALFFTVLVYWGARWILIGPFWNVKSRRKTESTLVQGFREYKEKYHASDKLFWVYGATFLAFAILWPFYLLWSFFG